MIGLRILEDGCILRDGDAYHRFDRGGNYVSESSPVMHMVEVNVVSLLSSSGKCETLVIDGDSVEHGFCDLLESLFGLNARGGFIRVLTRRGQHEGVRFTQTVFVYADNVDIKEVRKCIR